MQSHCMHIILAQFYYRAKIFLDLELKMDLNYISDVDSTLDMIVNSCLTWICTYFFPFHLLYIVLFSFNFNTVFFSDIMTCNIVPFSFVSLLISWNYSLLSCIYIYIALYYYLSHV